MTRVIDRLRVESMQRIGGYCGPCSLRSCNKKPASRMRPLHCAPITFFSREIHSELSGKQRTIIPQIPAMMPDLI
jgi:hypothetical protein